MKKRIAIGIGALFLTLAAGSLTPPVRTAEKLPKCTSNLCRSVGCSPDVLCVRGAHVVNCADVCGGG